MIAIKVFEFEGKDPEGFTMEGRIVSNRVEIEIIQGAQLSRADMSSSSQVEIHPFGIEFIQPVEVKIPHCCADEDVQQTMYAASFSVLQDGTQLAQEATGEMVQ